MYNERLISVEIFGRGMNISNDLVRGTKLKSLINKLDSGTHIVNYIINNNKDKEKDKNIRSWLEMNIFDLIKIFDCYYRNDHNFPANGLFIILRRSLKYNSKVEIYYLILHRMIFVSQILEVDQRILKTTGDWLSTINYFYLECYNMYFNLPKQECEHEIEHYLQLSYGYDKSMIGKNYNSVNNLTPCEYMSIKIFNKTSLNLNKIFVQRTRLKECIDIDNNKSIEKLLLSFMEKEDIDLSDYTYVVDLLTKNIKIIDYYFIDYEMYKDCLVNTTRHYVPHYQKFSLLTRYKMLIFIMETLSIKGDVFLQNDKHFLEDLHLYLSILMKYSCEKFHSQFRMEDIKQTIDAILDHIHPKVNVPTLYLPLILRNNHNIKNKILQQLKTNYFSTLRFI